MVVLGHSSCYADGWTYADGRVVGLTCLGPKPTAPINGRRRRVWPSGQRPIPVVILPGELNQPVHVPHLEGRRCAECGQVLPESHQPPADEPWTTGICRCADEPGSCRTGLFCPCVLFGRNVEALREDIPWTSPCVCHAVFVEGGVALAILTAIFHGVDPSSSILIGEGLMFSWWLCGTYTGIFRQELQKKYHLKNSPCDPCMVHCCMHWCANCQEHRERRVHLMDNVDASVTIVDPPPVEEMGMPRESCCF